MLSFAELARGECRDPSTVLGPHREAPGRWTVRVFLPWARRVDLLRDGVRTPMVCTPRASGCWTLTFPHDGGSDGEPPPYRLVAVDEDGGEWEREDPYRLPPTLHPSDFAAFLEGRERRAHSLLGAHVMEVEGCRGTRFAVWAPRARSVQISGDLNGWDPRTSPMRPVGDTGVWELFVPGVDAGTRYKYRVVPERGAHRDKSDPFGRLAEVRPANASVVVGPSAHDWTDAEWLARRSARHAPSAPMSVYEVHAGSWRRKDDGSWLGYGELAATLLPYVHEMGFTHVEFLPLTEHPLDESWGYQPVGFFAPTSRFGEPDGFRHFVDRAHALGIGVLLDWVPGHFAQDEHGLGSFDGAPLFEPEDPVKARHPDWGTLTFDYARPEVRSFLISSAVAWLEEFHVDGLRVDAVASMLYLDYSRGPGEWTPNAEGGNTDLDAIAFLRELNRAVREEAPGAVTVAEESTAWDGVTRPVEAGGLGFHQKWNMGWMNDVLRFFGTPAAERSHAYGTMQFSLSYAWSERFLLPLSHDEVVHGKASLLAKMPGADDEKFADLRTLLTWQWMHPGKQLLFMGGEVAQRREWAVGGEVEWGLLDFAPHRGIQRLVRRLNEVHARRPALHARDHEPDGFEWMEQDRPGENVLAFVRWDEARRDPVLVVANFGPAPHPELRVRAPHAGPWRTLVDTDAEAFGGGGSPLPERLQGDTLVVPMPPRSVRCFALTE